MTTNTTIICKDDDGIRIDRWFKRHHPDIPFGIIAKLIRKGSIRLDSKKTEVSTKIKTGMTISYPTFQNIIPIDLSTTRTKTDKPNNSFITKIQESVIFMDENIIAINKPLGIAVQGGTNIKVSIDELAKHIQFDGPIIPKLVHRLDKDTSGVLLLARNNKTAAALSLLFKERKLEKRYIAIVKGLPRPFSGKIDIPLAKVADEENYEKMQRAATGRKAITYYKVLDYAADVVSLVEFEIITGRTHQIRAHMSHIGHPILGDSKYSKRTDMFANIKKHIYLHSYHTTFSLFGKDYSITANPTKDFLAAIKHLGLNLNF